MAPARGAFRVMRVDLCTAKLTAENGQDDDNQQARRQERQIEQAHADALQNRRHPPLTVEPPDPAEQVHGNPQHDHRADLIRTGSGDGGDDLGHGDREEDHRVEVHGEDEVVNVKAAGPESLEEQGKSRQQYEHQLRHAVQE